VAAEGLGLNLQQAHNIGNPAVVMSLIASTKGVALCPLTRRISSHGR
jgi:hypothetical protein